MGKPKRWEIGFSRDNEDSAISEIARAIGVRELTAALLYHRGCRTPEEARSFLRLEGTLLHDPFLLKNMDKAAARLNLAIAKKEKICIWGDYDADGVTATTVLVLYLRKRGAVVDYLIPDRIRDGYGMNERAVRELWQAGTELIVTVDNGITALAPIALAKELGMEVVVTDHHEPHGELPQAGAVVNPHRSDCAYPFKELAGVGVAFKLICAAEIAWSAEQGKAFDYLNDLCLPYLDLVAIGTVADVMSLKGENRLIVSMGLRMLAQNCRLGLKALLEQASGQGKRVTASTVSFLLAPRINAAGRLGSAMRAVELLLADTEQEAARLAAELCEMNRERQSEENGIFLSAQERIMELGAEGDLVLILDHDDWHPGVTGIVSSRVTERYGKPSFLITFDHGVGKGSGRSIGGVNLMALLSGCSDLLLQYGGHEMAAGLTIERDNLDAFRERINSLAEKQYPGGFPEQVTAADCTITLSDVTEGQIEELSIFEPCGTDNPQPLFVLPGAVIAEITPVGAGRHTRFLIKQGDRAVTAMYFGVSAERMSYRIGDTVDLLVQMELNAFGGHISPQLLIRDMDFPLDVRTKAERHRQAYEAFLGGDDSAIPNRALPAREDFIRTYQYLRKNAALKEMEIGFRALYAAVFGIGEWEEAGWKLALILAVFVQTGLLSAEETEAGVPDAGTQRDRRLRIGLQNPGGKVDLHTSALYCRIEAVRNTAQP